MRMTSLRPKLRARHAREFRASLELRGVRDMVDDQRDVQAPLPRLDGPQIGRRGFLRVLALGALGFAPQPILPSLIRAALGGSVVRSMGDAARAPSGRIRQWTMIIDLRYCDGCQSVGKPPRCTAACIEGHFAPEPMERIEGFDAELPGGATQFIPTPCQQCQNPPCAHDGPLGAPFSSPEGTVLNDQGPCIACRICMAACPYDRR